MTKPGPKPGQGKPPAGNLPGKKLKRGASNLAAHLLADRRAKVASLRARGNDYNQIAHQLGVSYRTIQKDLQVIAKSWHEHMLLDYRVIREREVGLLEAARAEVLEQWETAVNRFGEDHQASYMAIYARLTQLLHDLLHINDPLSFTSARVASNTAQMQTKIIEIEIRDREELRNFEAMTLQQYELMIAKSAETDRSL